MPTASSIVSNVTSCGQLLLKASGFGHLKRAEILDSIWMQKPFSFPKHVTLLMRQSFVSDKEPMKVQKDKEGNVLLETRQFLHPDGIQKVRSLKMASAAGFKE